MLLLAATIWGTAFVAQSVGMEYVQPFTFSAVRMLLGAIALLPLAWLRHRRGTDVMPGSSQVDRYAVIKGSLVCGTFLCIATNLQQFGILYTTVGKAGFITALYIVLVPVLRIFMGKRAGRNIWCGVVIAAAGLYLLCMNGSFTLASGDIYVMICALFFALQIISVDHYGAKADAVLLSMGQFLVCGVLSFIVMLFREQPTLGGIYMARIALLYTGILSSGVAYTLQVAGQQRMEPARASLIMCLESPISLIAGWVILGQAMSGRELVGCGLMFTAILISQFGGESKRE